MKAHERKIIGDDEFIHEIIFKIPNVNDSKKQNFLITQMIGFARASKSRDAGNVLLDAVGFLFKYADHVKLESQTGSELKNMLIQNEPQFNVEEGLGYDMRTAANYCSWLNSYAKSDNKSEVKTIKFMVDTLNSNTIDPRKIIAVMLSDRSQEVLDLARNEGRLGNLQNSLKVKLLKLTPGTEIFKLHQSVLNKLN